MKNNYIPVGLVFFFEFPPLFVEQSIVFVYIMCFRERLLILKLSLILRVCVVHVDPPVALKNYSLPGRMSSTFGHACLRAKELSSGVSMQFVWPLLLFKLPLLRWLLTANELSRVGVQVTYLPDASERCVWLRFFLISLSYFWCVDYLRITLLASGKYKYLSLRVLRCLRSLFVSLVSVRFKAIITHLRDFVIDSVVFQDISIVLQCKLKGLFGIETIKYT